VSEEMSGRSETLRELISRFKIKGNEETHDLPLLTKPTKATVGE
jgi:hypothetical protein